MSDEDLVARTVRLPRELANWLRLKAVTAGMSENSYMRSLIEADRAATRTGQSDAEMRAAAVERLLDRYNLDADSPEYRAAAAAARADVQRGRAQGAA
jgi:hypothetical protein